MFAGGVEEQERFVRFLVRSAFVKRRGADIEVVEAFDGGGEKHGARKAERLRE